MVLKKMSNVVSPKKENKNKKKNMENVRKHNVIKLLTNKVEIIYLVSETSYYIAKSFCENIIFLWKRISNKNEKNIETHE